MAEQQVGDVKILGALHDVIDPELGINVVDLGLVYSAEERDGDLNLLMTMPACPLHPRTRAYQRSRAFRLKSCGILRGAPE